MCTFSATEVIGGVESPQMLFSLCLPSVSSVLRWPMRSQNVSPTFCFLSHAQAQLRSSQSFWPHTGHADQGFMQEFSFGALLQIL